MKTSESDPANAPASSRRVKFSLAANYDPALVSALTPYAVDEVYGKFPGDGISGGRPWQKRMLTLLAKLGEMGVRRVTVSTPFLLDLVKRRFPEFKVRVGIYAQVDTPRRARFWEELGADAIVLESFSINRNFCRLTAIRQAVHCDLELIAIVRESPRRPYRSPPNTAPSCWIHTRRRTRP